MSVIQFDVLVPPAAAGEVRDAFQRALDILVRREMLASGTVAMQRVRIDDSVRAELAETYERDRGEPAEGAETHRYRIDVEGAESLNSLAMGLSRILTPKAELPRDPVMLEDQDRFEAPSIYPWTVEVFR
ncbi:hypothetical protein [Corynebacterium ureicelerivorans]|uniref:Uncharacterized protein n=1 Tax=Corynebacterium ureicelerivorans TaxID=401472 RepID=A0A077HLK0_9CORY|nr:hypothetical protein [Corynebacterium ureicelerivorans]AIL97184.1 hypothetical protein CUREI_07650 [Corynebacterium ureicelerivorans]